MTRKEILEAAEKCVTGKREQDYGSPEDSFNAIASFWQTYVALSFRKQNEDGEKISFRQIDIANMMMLLKIARAAQNPFYADNYIDICGYSACAGEIATKNVPD